MQIYLSSAKGTKRIKKIIMNKVALKEVEVCNVTITLRRACKIYNTF